MKHDEDGHPIPEHKKTPPCQRTPCGSYEGKPRLRREWIPLVLRYRQFRVLGSWPQAGGVRDQNPIDIGVFMAMRQAEMEIERQARQKMASTNPLGYLLSLPQTGR